MHRIHLPLLLLCTPTPVFACMNDMKQFGIVHTGFDAVLSVTIAFLVSSVLLLLSMKPLLTSFTSSNQKRRLSRRLYWILMAGCLLTCSALTLWSLTIQLAHSLPSMLVIVLTSCLLLVMVASIYYQRSMMGTGSRLSLSTVAGNTRHHCCFVVYLVVLGWCASLISYVQMTI